MKLHRAFALLVVGGATAASLVAATPASAVCSPFTWSQHQVANPPYVGPVYAPVPTVTPPTRCP